MIHVWSYPDHPLGVDERVCSDPDEGESVVYHDEALLVLGGLGVITGYVCDACGATSAEATA